MPKVAADALALPFADAVFDAVTIAFGLRNVHDPDRALAELARVTKPGGRLVVCEFGRPTWAPFRAAYYLGLERVLPAVADRVSSNPEAYRYLGESIRDWPAQPELAARIAARAGPGSGGATSRAAPSRSTAPVDRNRHPPRGRRAGCIDFRALRESVHKQYRRLGIPG